MFTNDETVRKVVPHFLSAVTFLQSADNMMRAMELIMMMMLVMAITILLMMVIMILIIMMII